MTAVNLPSVFKTAEVNFSLQSARLQLRKRIFACKRTLWLMQQTFSAETQIYSSDHQPYLSCRAPLSMACVARRCAWKRFVYLVSRLPATCNIRLSASRAGAV